MNKKTLPRAIRPDADAAAAAKPAAAAAAPLEAQPAPSGADTKDRRARAIAVIKRLSLWSGAAGLIPVPFVDLAAVGGVQVEMLRRISKIYDVPFSKNIGKALISGAIGSMVPASSGIGAASLIKGVPGLGTAISAITMPALSVGASYAIGMAFIQHFESGGTLLDFEPPDYKEFLKADPDRGQPPAKQATA
ncbi:MAG TPA: YcjF family protein [Pseudolabrys sp.]|nr:YcjF family protein [Pseudolabrys sp.]